MREQMPVGGDDGDVHHICSPCWLSPYYVSPLSGPRLFRHSTHIPMLDGTGGWLRWVPSCCSLPRSPPILCAVHPPTRPTSPTTPTTPTKRLQLSEKVENGDWFWEDGGSLPLFSLNILPSDINNEINQCYRYVFKFGLWAMELLKYKTLWKLVEYIHI